MPILIRSTLHPLIDRAWAEWDRARAHAEDSAHVPEDSTPVLWFGESQRYLASSCRVLTLGVNPGPQTFPAAAPWVNLPLLGEVRGAARREPARSVAAFDGYPLNSWFNAFNPLLEPFQTALRAPGAPDVSGTALHVDLTPLMTRGVFSALPPSVAQRLREQGIGLLNDLVTALEPAVTVASLSRTHFRAASDRLELKPRIRFPQAEGARHEAWLCTWNQPGAFLWVRKTGHAPVSPSRTMRTMIGQWAASVLSSRMLDDMPVGTTWVSRSSPTRGPMGIDDVVAMMAAACPGGRHDAKHPHWEVHAPHGPRWGRRVEFTAPDGATAELGEQGNPARVEEFLRDWSLHAHVMRNPVWGRRQCKAMDHILFPVPGHPAGKHYSGLYFRWLP